MRPRPVPTDGTLSDCVNHRLAASTNTTWAVMQQLKPRGGHAWVQGQPGRAPAL